jgi:GT2 family glycosyltransferase
LKREALSQWNMARQQTAGGSEEALGFEKGIGVSVIICTRNRPDEMVRCLNSVARQSCLPQEVVIVDSSDSPVLETRLGAWRDGGTFEMRYVRSAPGLPRQRNIGVRESSGDILFFLDDDVVLERDFIREIKKVFDGDPSGKVGGVVGDILEAREARRKRQWWQRLLRRLFFLADYGSGEFRLSGFGTWPQGLDEIRCTELLSGCEMAFRRKVFDELGFDERLTGYAYLEDVDFSYRVSRKYRNVYTPFAKCRHIQSQDERLDKAERKKMLLSNHAYLFRKNMPQTLAHKVAFWLSIIGLKWVPPIEYYIGRVYKAIIGELPWSKRQQNAGIGGEGEPLT